MRNAMSQDIIEQNNEMICNTLKKLLPQVHQKHIKVSQSCTLKNEI